MNRESTSSMTDGKRNAALNGRPDLPLPPSFTKNAAQTGHGGKDTPTSPDGVLLALRRLAAIGSSATDATRSQQNREKYRLSGRPSARQIKDIRPGVRRDNHSRSKTDREENGLHALGAKAIRGRRFSKGHCSDCSAQPCKCPAVDASEMASLAVYLQNIGHHPRYSQDDKDEAFSAVMLDAIERAQQGDIATRSYWARRLRTSVKTEWYNRTGGADARLDGDTAQSPEDLLAWFPTAGDCRQEKYVDAMQALRTCQKLPRIHRAVLARRADNADALEIARELQKSPQEILRLLDEARHWIRDGYV